MASSRNSVRSVTDRRRPIKAHLAGARANVRPVRLSAKQSLPFLKSLKGLVAGGYSAGEAVRLLKGRVKNRRLQFLASALWEQLSEGSTLSGAMTEWPGVFDDRAINLVRAGEATGNLGDVLDRIIAYMTESHLLRRRIINSLSYPCFICVLAGGMILFFMTFLFPKLETLLHSLGGKMPLPTQVLLDFSTLLLHFGPFAILAGGAVAFGFAYRWRTPAGRLWTDGTLLRLPIIGSLVAETSIQGFCQTLAVLLENGINTVDALRIAEKTVPNRALGEGLMGATGQVVEGQSLVRVLARIPHIPDYVLDRLSLGENTGKLAPQLRDLADSMQEELSQRIKSITSIISTSVLMAAFLFVGFIAYAIVSALLQVSASIKL